MAAKNSVPLGYVDLPDGSKAIYPMNDIFLNYTFEDVEYWEALRLTANLIIAAYKQYKPTTKVKTITGDIKVRTQYQHLFRKDNTTRDQDLKMVEDDANSTYLEFQNRAKPDVPIEIRSVEYFGLGIGQSKGKLANQIWLLAQDVETVLYDETFTRYILNDEVTGKDHPTTSGIMYVSLTKLSKEDSPAGEMAAFLLGKVDEPKNEVVKKITDAFKKSFQTFKTDKEVARMLSLADRYRHDGVVEGEERGAINAADKFLELIKSGFTPEDAHREITSEYGKHKEK